MNSLHVQGFQEVKLLGRGNYGNVYKVRRERDGKVYALKTINIQQLSPQELQDSLNEIRLLASFRSPFITRFYESFYDDYSDRLCIVTEYAPLGDLGHLIARRRKLGKPLNESVIWRYLLQLMSALKTMHSLGVVHRDLKSANILLAAPDMLKVGDLGVATVLRTNELAKTQIGTPLYIAPEVWQKKPYNEKCDVWALGVLLYEMMTLEYPFYARKARDLANRVCQGSYTVPWGQYSKQLHSVLHKLLTTDPDLRPSIRELMETRVISERLSLLELYMSPNTPPSKLLSPIPPPEQMRNVCLPPSSYDRQDATPKKLEERLHIKKGAPIRKLLPNASSPELRLITDFDWWCPNEPVPEPSERALKTPRPPPLASLRCTIRRNPRANPRFRRLAPIPCE